MGGGHHHFNPAAEPKRNQDQEALRKHKVPLAFRDTCAHLLIPLNKCRGENFFSPNQCGHERHTYEECLYYAWLQRIEVKKQLSKMQAETEE